MTMKQLIYRELYLSKKNIWMTLGIAGMFLVLMVLILLSCRFGNIAKYNEPDDLKEMIHFISEGSPILFYGLALIAGIDAIPNQIFGDHLCGWHKFIKSSGVKVQDYVGAKYVAILILFVAATIMTTILYPVFFLLSGKAEISMTGMIAVLDFVLIITDFNLPMFLWAKSREKALYWSLIPIFVFGGLIVLAIKIVNINVMEVVDDEVEKLIMSYSNGELMPMVSIALLILAVLMYVSYKISVHLVEVEG